MSKYTPGPWKKVSGLYANAPTRIWAKQGEMLAEVTVADGSDFAEHQANARLIAAAPELLEAAKKMVAYIGENAIREFAEAGNPGHLLIAAIDKAEGNSNG